MHSSRRAWPSTRSGPHTLASLALLAASTACHAGDTSAATPFPETTQHAPTERLRPLAFFTQFGVAEEVTAATAGLIWNPGWDVLPAPWTVYFEASLSRWNSRGGQPSDHGVLTQVALIPVFRWRADQGRSPWFWEGGIGATVTSSVYSHADKRFSTSFNFGDHLGVGHAFGTSRKHEVALRLEHYSNAGIKHPNPGENFLQLRYVRYFD